MSLRDTGALGPQAIPTPGSPLSRCAGDPDPSRPVMVGATPGPTAAYLSCWMRPSRTFRRRADARIGHASQIEGRGESRPDPLRPDRSVPFWRGVDRLKQPGQRVKLKWRSSARRSGAVLAADARQNYGHRARIAGVLVILGAAPCGDRRSPARDGDRAKLAVGLGGQNAAIVAGVGGIAVRRRGAHQAAIRADAHRLCPRIKTRSASP